MLIPPKYTLTPRISQLLAEIESAKEVINSISMPIEIERNVRRQTTLKSSLFSAKVEGNSLSMEDLSKSSKDQQKVEVLNILKALDLIQQKKTEI